MNAERALDVRRGVRLEMFTVAWMVIEMAVSIGAGISAGSLLLIAFGIDSLIELVSGGVLLWRLSLESRGGDLEQVKQAERRAAWIVAVALALLCAYVLVSALYGFFTRSKPESSPVGIGVTVAAALVMPYLAVNKRRLSRRIDSDALAGDAVSSFTCAYMALTVLAGLALNAIFGWWWVEDLASLLFLAWLLRETLEAFGATRPGE
jgi:divalent metal cation (Fe/Co/Zn/Cd) transporter